MCVYMYVCMYVYMKYICIYMYVYVIYMYTYVIYSHFYANDIQIYLSFSPELTTVFSLIELCIKDIFSWMITNKLSINPNKMEYLLFNPKYFNNPNCSINIECNIIWPMT